MRVVAGSARGHKLVTLKGNATRPTAGRLKEALFSMITDDLPDAVFLDMFSGSGQIGIEALSRGARYAVFIEKDKRCADIIRKNIAHVKFSEKARIICADCLSEIKRLNVSFDIVFLDPPYGSGLVQQALMKILEYDLLNPGGYIIVEQSASEDVPVINGLSVFNVKNYNTAAIVFLKKQTTEK